MYHDQPSQIKGFPSSPTRGTWIEIPRDGLDRGAVDVVPHAGDVDRNATLDGRLIEKETVVPHAGDVDRN